MHYAYLIDNIVAQIIPAEDPVFPGVPIVDRYAPKISSSLVAIAEGVEVAEGWLYDVERETFSKPLPPEVEQPPLEDMLLWEKERKLAELSTACNTSITAGCDVTLTDGTTGHISMTDEDQINLMSAMSTVAAGAAGYPYHLDGELCRVYAASDILTMGTAATRHKLYHTTYCNHLLVWVRRCETVAEVEGITYGCALPEDLARSLEEVLASAATV